MFVERGRFVLGLGCVSAAAVLLAVHLSGALNSLDGSVRFYAYIRTPLVRVLTTGDSLDIPYGLQAEALRVVPRGAGYALVLPPSAQAAARDGINPVTYVTVAPFLAYLLLPAYPVRPLRARYVICYGCDGRRLGERVRWLWSEGHEQAIGEVER